MQGLKFRTTLLKCARHLSEEFNHLLEPHQLNYSLWQVVYLLHEKNSSTSIDIAKYLNVSKPSIAKRVQVLEQLNLIEHVSTTDKRQKMIKLNTQGLHIYALCSAEIDQYETQLLQHLNPIKLDTTLEVLTNLLNSLETKKTGAE